MTVYLLRHAPTKANEHGLILGDADVPASPEGVAAFASIAGLLRGRGIVRVFSSPLSRAAGPAQVLARELAAPLEILPGLAELSAGSWEGRPRHALLAPGQPLRGSWTGRPGNGESMAGAEPRVALALERIQSLGRVPVALVGHAVLNRVILKLLGHGQEDRLLRFVHPFGTIIARAPDGGYSWMRADGTCGQGLPGVAGHP